MIRGKEVSPGCTVDPRIQHAEMFGNKNPVDGRHLLRFAEGVLGGFIILVRMGLPESVDQHTTLGQEAVGIGPLLALKLPVTMSGVCERIWLRLAAAFVNR